MLELFLDSIRRNSLIPEGGKVLIGLSGGIDSVIMMHLFQEAGFSFGIAHCNFQLRGEESEADEKFVRQLAEVNQVPVFVTRFDTIAYCEEKKISVQMGARDLRYTWFEEIAKDQGYDCIAIAHNRDDLAETMLLNLIRGTGLKGLTGMKPRNGLIIRPLLFASRKAIQSYAVEKGLSYREDSSNRETKYHRNLIRSEIIPLMEKINPSFTDTLIGESEIFDATWQVYSKEIEILRNELTEREGEILKMSIAKIRSLRISLHVLYDILTPYGFNLSVVKDIYQSLETGSGRKFYSEEFILVRDRHFLLIEKENPEKGSEFLVGEDIKELHEPISMQIRRVERDITFELPSDPGTAALDLDLLQFPLKLRHWKEGDFFIPLGMKGKKKLSDFFIDRKIPLLEKQRIWLLTSGEDIVWVMMQQIDERYKVTDQTQRICFFELTE